MAAHYHVLLEMLGCLMAPRIGVKEVNPFLRLLQRLQKDRAVFGIYHVPHPSTLKAAANLHIKRTAYSIEHDCYQARFVMKGFIYRYCKLFRYTLVGIEAFRGR